VGDGAPATPQGGPAQPDGRAGTGNVDVRESEDTASAADPGGGRRSLAAVLWGIIQWAALLLAGYVVVVPLALLALRGLRRLRARTPAERVELAWREATEAAVEAGIPLGSSLTVAESARRLRTEFTEQAGEIDLVASWVEQVNYAEVAPTDDQARSVAQAGHAIAAAAGRTRSRYARLLRHLDARRLLPQPQHARRMAHGAVRTA
jgi:hypothetical protein